ncbi:glycosyltransferase family 2 protein [Paraburkholderia piptadeniae]|uniref:glycosyltransferase family 2 protein n=1 Tax=Paraburkholderia piptadeniae TaxID=1701573 RepID=UPI00117DCA52|nr:glycosyltransferase family 2 protein [Paraburkholderia piptadeniae]
MFDYLLGQVRRPDAVYVVGAGEADIAGLDTHPMCDALPVFLLISETAGLTAQRNYGVSAMLREVDRANAGKSWFLTFFDDDFRPHAEWLSSCETLLSQDPDVVGVTGQILADGVKTAGVCEADARRYLSGALAPREHWASGTERREISSAYGCNMAFVDRVARVCRFEEALPLYGWQEDQDYTSQAQRFGKFVYEPACRGVHLGIKKGRISGVRLGYSQIANPVFLVKKNTMARKTACVFISRHILSNLFHSLRRDPLFDYRGRLWGNLLAFADLLAGTSHPQRILKM